MYTPTFNSTNANMSGQIVTFKIPSPYLRCPQILLHQVAITTKWLYYGFVSINE